MNLNAYITSCKFHGELHIGLTWRLMYTSQDMNSVLIYGKGIRFLRSIGLVICLIYILEFEGNAFISMGPALMSLIITKAVDSCANQTLDEFRKTRCCAKTSLLAALKLSAHLRMIFVV